MSKTSQRARAKRKARPTMERGEFVIYLPPNGVPLRFTEKREAVYFCQQNGLPFFYEMDGGGPFFEQPRLCWKIEEHPTDPALFLTVPYEMHELKCTCGCQL